MSWTAAGSGLPRRSAAKTGAPRRFRAGRCFRMKANHRALESGVAAAALPPQSMTSTGLRAWLGKIIHREGFGRDARNDRPEALFHPNYFRFEFLFAGTPRKVFAMIATRFQKIIALWLLAGAMAFAFAWQLDDAAGHALIVDAKANPDLHHIAAMCSKLGEGWVIAVAGILGASVFFFLKRPEMAARIFFVALTSSIAGLVATIIRSCIGRTRPNNHSVAQGFYGLWHDGHWIIGQAAFSSLPSGHAASAVGVAAAAWLISRSWGAAFSVYALAVMWSRIALECHHLSDVTASAFLAIVTALLLRKHFAAANEAVFQRLAGR